MRERFIADDRIVGIGAGKTLLISNAYRKDNGAEKTYTFGLDNWAPGNSSEKISSQFIA